MTIGESIRYHRKKLNLTQAQLAERLKVTPQAVSKWESGTGLPDLSMAAPLARALGITTDELLRFGERYEEFNKLWREALREDVNDYVNQLAVAESALREFHWDKPFMYRAAVAARILSERTDDPVLREEYLGRAAGHAQCLRENDPEDQYGGRRLHRECMQELKEIWARKKENS